MTSICLLLLPRSSCLFNKLFSAGSQGKKKTKLHLRAFIFFWNGRGYKNFLPLCHVKYCSLQNITLCNKPPGFPRGLGNRVPATFLWCLCSLLERQSPEHSDEEKKTPIYLDLTKNIFHQLVCLCGTPGMLRITPWDCPHPLGDVGGGLIYSCSSSVGSDD